MPSNFHPQRVLALAVVLVAIAFVIVKIRRFYLRRQFAHRNGCQPVAKRFNREPFLGIDTVFYIIRAHREHNVLEKTSQRFHDLGNTFVTRELLNSYIITTEPENIKTVLSLNFNDYGIGHRLETFGPLLGAGIFDTDGEHWAASRALIRPNFTRDQVADLAAFENLIPNLFAHLPRDGTTVVDLQELFFRYTIDSATEFLFGQSVGSLKMSGSDLDFAQAFNYAQRAIIWRDTLGPLKTIFRDKKAEQCNRICREFGQQFVDEAIRAVEAEKTNPDVKDNKYRFSHELARRTSDKLRILDELLNILLAGRDTTASMLSNLFFMLAKHPEKWDRLRNEVAKLDGRVPTYEELRDLKYVQCCLKESLRLHPVVPRNQRLALRDTILPVGGGKNGLSPVFVPKGTLVQYNIYAMHRRKDFYGPDADEFRPERWEDGQLQPRWEYLPFNGGPRICIGQRYALTEVGYVLVRMAQEFRVLQSQDPGPWVESLTLTVCSQNGVKVSLTPA